MPLIQKSVLSNLTNDERNPLKMEELDRKPVKRQLMSKEKLWKTFRKPGELLFKITLKDYNKVWLLGNQF